MDTSLHIDPVSEQEAFSQLPLGQLESPELMRELISPGPRQLWHIGAELLFLDGPMYVLHYRDEQNREGYKFLSPASLSSAFSNLTSDSGWLGEGIVRTGKHSNGDWVVKFLPPAIWSLHLTGATDTPYAVPLPGLVMAGLGKTYWLWAVKETVFSSTSQVYRAPLNNVYHDHRICWGQNSPPSVSVSGIGAAWNMFVSAVFNDSAGNDKSKASPTNVNPFLQRLAARNQRKYPLHDLQSVGRTTEELVEELLGLNEEEKRDGHAKTN